ncbi:MAG: FAD-dependent oxidoreductase [Myxococcota bacterium]
MIADASDAPGTLRTRVCIVGSGPAGMTVALELEKHGVDCILLESGGREPDGGHMALGETAQVGIRTDAGNRIRALGGTSAVWGGLCRRLDAHDFERRPWVPHSGWPIGLPDLLPHYETAHRLLGLPPAEYDPARVDPARGSDVPLRGGDLYNVAFYYNGRPMRFGEHYAPALEASRRIHTWLDATVVDLETDADGRRVVAAVATTLAGRRFRVEADRFVVACGAIQNARLLLNARGLAVAHGRVGRFFLQHPVWYEPRLLTWDLSQTLRTRRSDRAEVVMTTAIRPEAAERHGLLSFHFMTIRPAPTPGLDEPRRLWRHWRKRAPELFAEPTDDEAVADWLTGLQRAVGPGGAGDPQDNGMEIRPEQAPNPESRIRLSDERDATGLRRAVMDWRLGDLDRESLAKGARLVARSLALADVGRVRAGAEALHVPDPGGDWLHGGNHHYGTTRMSDSPRHGVVDRDCRVHGTANLYVAGSSVFPTTGYANPTLTIVALSARLAETLSRSR